VFEDEGQVNEYVGGYDDWVRQRQAPARTEARDPAASKPQLSRPKAASQRKLSYKEQRELEKLPASIETLEGEIAQIQSVLSDPSFYRKSGAEVATVTGRLAELRTNLETAYARWEMLEAQRDT
jgi:ATP-binding cassette subfamily F protein uup